jgi:hypothetical protein
VFIRVHSWLNVFAFQLFHHAADQLFRVADGPRDHLDVHSGFTGLAGTLAIDAVLPYQYQRIGQDVQRDRQPSVRAEPPS